FFDVDSGFGAGFVDFRVEFLDVDFGFGAGFVDFGVEFFDLGLEFLVICFGFGAGFVDFAVEFLNVGFELVFQVAHAGADVADQHGSDAEQCAPRHPGVPVHESHSFTVPVSANGCQHARHPPASGNTPSHGPVDNEPHRAPVDN